MGKKWTVAQKQAAKEKREANAALNVEDTTQHGDSNPVEKQMFGDTSNIQPSEDKLDAILNLVEGFSARLEKVEGQSIKFVPMTPEDKPIPDVSNTYQVPEELKASGMKALTADGEMNAWGSRSTDDPAYINNIPQNLRPIFGIGSQVRLNPEVIPEGGDGRTWAEIHDYLPVGTVKNLQYMDKTTQPKYTVVFMNGITKKIGSGFREQELLPA